MPRLLHHSELSIHCFHGTFELPSNSTCWGCLKEVIQQMAWVWINAIKKHSDSVENSELVTGLLNSLIRPFCPNFPTRALKAHFNKLIKADKPEATGHGNQREAYLEHCFSTETWAIFPAEASFYWTVFELTAVHSLTLWGSPSYIRTCINPYVHTDTHAVL